ncbi:MAG: metallophosphoesterase [Saprospiraceae bacterium]
MKKILLLSDTHSYLDSAIMKHVAEADEVWHAGDIGNFAVYDTLDAAAKTLRIVHGNIDEYSMHTVAPENLDFTVEGLRVFMTHIGGYPGRYNGRVKDILRGEPGIDLFICGHSHILKVMPDKMHNLLHMNPGACGIYGFHLMRTMIRFQIEEGRILKPEVIELGKRGAITPESSVFLET